MERKPNTREHFRQESGNNSVYQEYCNKVFFTDSYVYWLERKLKKANSEASNSNSIDKVTTNNLDIAFRAVGISCDIDTVDKIIDLVELLEEGGGNTTLEDIVKLQEEWKFSKNNQ